MLGRVGEERQDRHHEHAAVEPRVPHGGDGGEALLRAGRARLNRLLQLVVVDRDRHGEVDGDVL